MFISMLVAVAVASPGDWGVMIPRGPAPTPQKILKVMKALQPPPGLPPAPLAFTLNVSPPGAAAYSVRMTFNGASACWEGVIPAGAKSPFQNAGGGVYRVIPYQRQQFPDPADPTSYGLLIRCNPPIGSSDFGGGYIRHNAGPGFSAGPADLYIFLKQGSTTVGYAFTVGP